MGLDDKRGWPVPLGQGRKGRERPGWNESPRPSTGYLTLRETRSVPNSVFLLASVWDDSKAMRIVMPL